MADDYFMQYGLDHNDTPKLPIEISKVSSLNLKKIDRNKVSITDVKGIRDDVPTFQYAADLEKKIERLEDTNRTLRSQVSNLHNRINQLAQSIAELAKKNFGNYEY